jgi:hypothetical protein
MPEKKSAIPESFMLALNCELEKHSTGISEYDLMQNLKSQGYFDFLSHSTLPHELFKAHFFLFHSLYLLRNILLEQKSHSLSIHVLKIQRLPYREGDRNLQAVDPLTAYYLDFSHLQETTEEDIYAMLASFWNKYNCFGNREEALTELGLKDPVDDKVIKKEYRRLAMKHHPDRGGNNEKLKNINYAVKLLLG